MKTYSGIGEEIPSIPVVYELEAQLECTAESLRLFKSLLRFPHWPVGWTVDITLDEAYDLWLSPYLASETKVCTFSEFIENALLPRGYRVI